MKKPTTRPPLSSLRGVLGKPSRPRLLDRPSNKEAADDLRLYLALVAIDALPMNLLGWTRERLPLFDITTGQQSIHKWVTSQDPTCMALVAYMSDAKSNKVVAPWIERARKEAASWQQG